MHVGKQMVSGTTLQTNMTATRTVIVEVRDGPLEKLWGGGIFEPQEFFFVIKFLV